MTSDRVFNVGTYNTQDISNTTWGGYGVYVAA